MIRMIFFALIVSIIFISGQSFWIDEGNSAFKASQPSIVEWWQSMHIEKGSDSQMPGYMIYIWLWDKFFPSGEFFLRMSNIPWYLLIIISFAKSRYCSYLLLSSPFILSYLDELRPYIMTMAGASLAINSIVFTDYYGLKRHKLFMTAILIMCASSLLGVVWSLGFVMFYFYSVRTNFQSLLRSKVVHVYFFLFIVLASYYFWTLICGQAAAPMGGNLLVSFGATAYEIVGLYGLGPAKYILRQSPSAILNYLPFVLPMVISFSIVTIFAIYIMCKTTKVKYICAFITCLCVPIAILVLLVFTKEFRLLGRHMAPLYVVIIAIFAHISHVVFVQDSNPLNNKYLKIIFKYSFIIYITFGIFSSMLYRFHLRHKKDDYRSAVAVARIAIDDGKKVLWAADKWTAYYYGLSQSHKNWKPWHKEPKPDLAGYHVVILSKPDIYDSSGSLSSSLLESNYILKEKFPAFTIYESYK